MQKSPKISANRRVEREGINAAQAFFEQNNCVFQEVSLQNDFGKDAYLDVTRDGAFGPLCVALQIKSGISYRTNSDDYFIPIDHHAETWRNSTVPIFGVVYDPDDKQLRWADLTAYLQNNPDKNSGSIPVSGMSILTDTSLADAFTRAIHKYSSRGSSYIFLNLLSDVAEQQISAVMDAWALGRSDARYLLLLRRVIAELSREATRRAIWVLGYTTHHPDIFWTSQNWIPDEIKDRVRSSFRWSVEEISHMFMALDISEIGRGSLGQSLHLILYEDYYIFGKMKQAVALLLSFSETDHAIHTLVTMLGSAENPSEILEDMITRHSELIEHEWIQNLRAAFRENNHFDLYD